MDQNEARPALTTYEDLAGRWDHAMVRPDLADEDIAAGCEMAESYGVACVSVRPTDVELAARLLGGTRVAVGSVVSFPHGDATTAVKIYETRDLLRRGAKEIDMVINIGKLRSRQFQYIESELLQVSNACHESGALLKVILENAYLTEDLKVIALKICKRCEVDFVKTSTGFAPEGWTAADVTLMKRVLKDECRIKAAGGIDTVEAALEAYELGADRIGGTRTVKVLDEWRKTLAAAAVPVSESTSL
ncbi:MAG: deoxyribose-phosphate aldolase [Bryobacterales bacterium]|nr:deoxyribose-phosphate aldolase [Bryobacterales bacterium]